MLRQADCDPDHASAVQVAQIALPLFLSRCRSMLQAHAAAISLHSEASKPGQLDDFMCMLEVLQLMNLPPAVADAAISPGSSLQVQRLLRCCMNGDLAQQAIFGSLS